MKALDKSVDIEPAPFTMMLTFGQFDSTQPYGIQWIATADEERIRQYTQTNDLSALDIDFTDTLQPEEGQLITTEPMLLQYQYVEDANGNRVGNFSKTEEKLQQLLLEVNIETIDGQPAASWDAQTIGLLVAPMYDHMPMDPFYITLQVKE